MGVHMFRCYIGRGKMSVSDLETRIDDWVASNAEWADNSVAHTLAERNTKLDGSGVTYYGIDVRFLLDDAKSNLLQKFEDKLKDKTDWYRVGYHRCTHDESSPSPCSFDPADDPDASAVQWTAKDTTIPSDIPDFPQEAYS